MSINSLLKMKCEIQRKTKVFDEYRNISLVWEAVASNVSCYIQDYTTPSGRLEYTEQGLVISNIFIGNFKVGQDIAVDDRVVCTTFTPTNLLVRSVNPIINAKTGKQSHIKCVLEVEAT